MAIGTNNKVINGINPIQINIDTNSQKKPKNDNSTKSTLASPSMETPTNEPFLRDDRRKTKKNHLESNTIKVIREKK